MAPYDKTGSDLLPVSQIGQRDAWQSGMRQRIAELKLRRRRTAKLPNMPPVAPISSGEPVAQSGRWHRPTKKTQRVVCINFPCGDRPWPGQLGSAQLDVRHMSLQILIRKHFARWASCDHAHIEHDDPIKISRHSL